MVVLAAAALAAGAPGAAAQQLEVGGWVGGVRSNEVTAVSMCYGDACGPSESRPSHDGTGLSAGVDGRLRLHDRVAVAAGVALARKGFGPGPAPTNRQVDSRYLEADVTVQLRVVSYGRAELWVEGGLAPSLLLHCQTAGTTIGGFEETDCEVPSGATGVRHGPAVTQDLGWLAGPRVRIPTPGGVVRVSARYVRGIRDIKPDEGGTTTNRSLVLAVGFSRRI